MNWHNLRKEPNDLPTELETVNIAYANHNPESYYQDIKDKIFSDASAVYYHGQWHWWSASVKDYLAEYGDRYQLERVDPDVEVVAWARIEPFLEVEE